MGNKTYKSMESKQTAEADSQSDLPRREPNIDMRKKFQKDSNNDQKSLESSGQLKSDTGTKGNYEPSLESLNVENVDLLMQKKTIETGSLQSVFDQIKMKRNVDVNRTSLKYATSKEKYLIQLISSGHKISIDLIAHVIDGCHIKAHLFDDNFGCCCGFILTKNEYKMHHFEKCQLDHKINSDLRCDKGCIYRDQSTGEFVFFDGSHLGGPPQRLQRIQGTAQEGDAPVPRPPPQPAPPPPDQIDH